MILYFKKKSFIYFYFILKILYFIYPYNDFLKKIYLKKYLFDDILNYVELKSNFNKFFLNQLINKFNNIFLTIKTLNYDLNLLEIFQIINIFEGNFDKWKYHQINLLKFQENLSNKSNLINKTNIRYIDDGYFLRTIGSHYTVDATIKAMKLGLIKKQKIYCKLTDKSQSCNDFMINKWKKYIKFVDRSSKKNNYLIPHHIYIPIYNNSFFHSHSSGLKINKMWDKLKKPPLINFSNTEIKLCNKILLKMGINKNDWFVTVHLRTSNYKGSDNYRDVNINDYIEAFNLIINCGGKIVLMGSKGDKTLKNFNNNFIDYANSSNKSPIMDIFLCSNCKFMFGTSSGLSAISYLFQKPIALTNYLPTSTLYLRNTDLFIPRLLKFKKTNKIVPFSQQFSWPCSFGISSGHYKNIMKMNFISNSEDEIYHIAKEMLVKLGIIKEAQKFLSKKDKILFKKISNKTLLSDEIFPLECNISNYFLKKHISYLN